MRGRVVLATLGGLGAAALVGVLSLIGLPPLFVTAWILIVVALGIVTRQTLFEEHVAWPPDRPTPPFRGSDVSRLAWTVNARTGAVGYGLVRRLDALMRHRLAAHGLDVDDPAHAERIDALLGPGVRTALSSRAVHRTDAERVLDAVEAIPLAPEKTTPPTLEKR